MADDDVICLSSDDEVAHDESPRKKAKNNYTPLTAKIEPKDNKKDTILCCLKRSCPDDNEKSMSNAIKKQKVDQNVVEEITIESPIKNEVTRPSTTIRDCSNELSVQVLRDKLENGTISINKVTVKKITELSKSSNQPKSGNLKITPVKNDDVEKQSVNSNSRESNGKNAISLRLHGSKSTLQNSNRLLNPVAKLKDGTAIYKSCSSQILPINHQLLDGNNETDTNKTIDNFNVQSHIEKSKCPSLNSKTGNGKLTGSGKCENIVDSIENPKAVANKTDNHPDQKINDEEKSGDCLTISAFSLSPEVLILPTTETPKSSRLASDKTGVETLLLNSSNDALHSEEIILPTNENSTDVSAQTDEKSKLCCANNSQNLNDEQNDILTKTTDSAKDIEMEKDSSSVSTFEIGDTTKSESSVSKIQTNNDEPAIKIMKTQRLLCQTMSKSDNQSNSNTEDTSKSVTTHNSKESKLNIANGDEKSISNDLKNPDQVQSSCLKRKSASPEIVEKAKKQNDDAFKFEPQPGCSKSLNEIIDGKPRLVVFDRKPVPLETEDTFSMFLSLCLQTDRSLDMEKIVAKLKRYYEQLNPAYAASQAFRDTLNEKRDLIMRKGKKVVYHYVQLLKEDMKAKKKIPMLRAKLRQDNGDVEGDKEKIADAVEQKDDTEETQRVAHKIKRIEKAMKECQKMITKYEEAEIDFDDENNSNYIKLDRFKERMVQLYTQMCKYTHEHPDAGRAYLRPKHLRVTQIPSVDQAINSFINSKLSVNKNKLAKGKSFVDGLIFPDYVDILECVEKVNKEQDLKFGKRAMQNLAEKAFTQMGKHLQEARQNDYWDTFSLNLDDNVDPANSDSDLLEKLARNRKIAEENEKKVFEEFVKRQEERKVDDKDDSPSDTEDEDDAEDEEQADEQQDNDTKTNRENCESDEEMSIGEDTDRETINDNDQHCPKLVETISQVSDAEDEQCAVEDDTMEHISRNNDVDTTSPASSPKESAGKESMLIEVILDDVETEDGENEQQDEDKLQQPLRIRSFAKPPDSWQCSQEGNEEKNMDNTTKRETLEDTEQEISVVSVVPGRDKVEKRKINSSIIRSINAPSTSTNYTTNDQNLKYITIAPGVKRPVRLPSSRVQNNVKNVVALSRGPQISLATNTKQVRIDTLTAKTSTPLQRPQLQINSRMGLQQPQQAQFLRLNNGKLVTSTVGLQVPNAPQFVTIAPNSMSIRPRQLLQETLSTLPQFRPGQRRPGINAALIRPQIPSPPRNSNYFTRCVSATSTPIQPRFNNNQQNNVKPSANLSAAQLSQVPVLRVNNGKYITSSSSENAPNSHQLEQNTLQQQQKFNNVAAAVAAAPVKGVNIAGSTTLPVLTPRINDNARTVQQQKNNVARAPRPGNQNRQTSEGGPKRKNDIL